MRDLLSTPQGGGARERASDPGRPLDATQIVRCLADAAGPSYSVTRLAEALAPRCRRSEVLIVESGADRHRTLRDGAALRSFRQDFSRTPALSRLALSQALSGALDAAAAGGSVLHVHGLWLMPNVYPGRAARRHGAPLVVAPRGMLGAAAIAFSSGRKRLFWRLLQEPALRSVTCFHATSAAEVEDIRAFGLTAPVAVIPNGIDLPDPAPRGHIPGRARRTVLHLGRIHPKKGIDRLLHAWLMVTPRHPGWTLRIVGPSEAGHAGELHALAARLGLRSVRFDGPLYGADKEAAYREAELFVLPTLNENFGMVVAEALAHGTPVISTMAAPWEGLRTHGCGWWTGGTPDAIAAALDDAMTRDPAALRQMGNRGREWMRRDFSWHSVGSRMAELYHWCAGQGDEPEFVVR